MVVQDKKKIRRIVAQVTAQPYGRDGIEAVALEPLGTADAMEFLIDKLKGTKDNKEFFDSMNQ